MEEIEMARVDCHQCESAVMICGKNGTSIGYIQHCPFCGAKHVEVEDKIWDSYGRVPLYPEYGSF